MKKIVKLLTLPIMLLSLTSCDLFNEIFNDGDTDTVHKKSYEPITGKFVLYEATDTRVDITNTYFEFDGSKGNFSMKYYEAGVLKKEGIFQRVVTYEDKIGLIQDNLHFNVKCNDGVEHIGAYTESFDPLDQFRIIEEYNGKDQKYYLSELPFVLGTYVREGKEYKEEAKTTQEKDYFVPTRECFTCELNGKYALDDDHYFYFVYPRINDYYAKSYFQYYSPSLSKPLEGFIAGRTYTNVDNVEQLIFTYSRQVQIYTSTGGSNETGIYFGYYSVAQPEKVIIPTMKDLMTYGYCFSHNVGFITLKKELKTIRCSSYVTTNPTSHSDRLQVRLVKRIHK